MSINPYPALRTNPFFTIQIKHIPTGEKVNFEGWVTQFSDTYTSNWNATPVYGRMDPLATYQGTGRSIQLGFDIVNDSVENAKFNLANIGMFMKFLYPVYDSAAPSLQNVLKAAPLLSMKWTNLISNANGEQLVGYINGPVSYSPDMGEGGFMTSDITEWASNEVYRTARMNTPANQPLDVDKIGLANYIPKKVNLSFAFTVIHTHLGGWSPETLTKAARAVAQDAGFTTFRFGGTRDIQAAFPNTVKAPPKPEGMMAFRAGVTRDADDAAPAGMNLGESRNEERRQRELALANSAETAADEGTITQGPPCLILCEDDPGRGNPE